MYRQTVNRCGHIRPHGGPRIVYLGRHERVMPKEYSWIKTSPPQDGDTEEMVDVMADAVQVNRITKRRWLETEEKVYRIFPDLREDRPGGPRYSIIDHEDAEDFMRVMGFKEDPTEEEPTSEQNEIPWEGIPQREEDKPDFDTLWRTIEELQENDRLAELEWEEMKRKPRPKQVQRVPEAWDWSATAAATTATASADSGHRKQPKDISTTKQSFGESQAHQQDHQPRTTQPNKDEARYEGRSLCQTKAPSFPLR